MKLSYNKLEVIFLLELGVLLLFMINLFIAIIFNFSIVYALFTNLVLLIIYAFIKNYSTREIFQMIKMGLMETKTVLAVFFYHHYIILVNCIVSSLEFRKNKKIKIFKAQAFSLVFSFYFILISFIKI